MRNIGLGARSSSSPADVVSRFGAMQSQEHGLAKWAIAHRSRGLVDEDLDAALAAGEIIRTHVLRPTWHFLAPADARWIMALSGPRVLQQTAPRLRELGLDARTLARCARVISKALEGRNDLTRAQLKDVLGRARIDREGQRLPWILIYCELEAIICSGGLSGKQHTYALFDELVPAQKSLERDEALARLLRLYLGSHGPATIKDFAWWSGFTVRDIKNTLVDLGSEVRCDSVENVEFYSLENGTGSRASSAAHLLQPFDEFVVGYTESRFFGDPRRAEVAQGWRVGAGPVIVIDGNVVGYWRRKISGDEVVVDAALYEPNEPSTRRSLEKAVKEFGRFTGRTPSLNVTRA